MNKTIVLCGEYGYFYSHIMYILRDEYFLKTGVCYNGEIFEEEVGEYEILFLEPEGLKEVGEYEILFLEPEGLKELKKTEELHGKKSIIYVYLCTDEGLRYCNCVEIHGEKEAERIMKEESEKFKDILCFCDKVVKVEGTDYERAAGIIYDIYLSGGPDMYKGENDEQEESRKAAKSSESNER